MRRYIRRTAVLVAAACCVAPSVAAQTSPKYQPPGADTLSPRAVAESLSVLRLLESTVRRQPKDYAAWHRLGMVAWALKTRDRVESDIKQLDHTRLGRMADTCLRIAHELAPDSTRYALMSARYQRESGFPITRLASHIMFNDAMAAARASLSPIEHAEAALELGQAKWIQYESFAHRRLETSAHAAPRSVGKGSAPRGGQFPELYEQGATGLGRTGGQTFPGASPPSSFGSGVTADTESNTSLDPARMAFDMAQGQIAMGAGTKPLKGILESVLQLTMDLPFDVQGESYYLEADALFREAYDAAPLHARTLRSLAKVLVEKDRWVPARTLAREHVASAPWDAQGWLLLGLATHRLQDGATAAKAFDSALVYMSPAERTRFERIERILKLKDSVMFAKYGDADRTAMMRRYWLASDPLWSLNHTPPRVEFLSRVAYSEFRWTLDDRGIKGADTDRGEVYIRYGPPDIIIGLSPSPKDYIAELAQFWAYTRIGMLFAFNGAPTYGTMRFPFEDREYARGVMDEMPVRWDNTTNLVIDPLAVRTARFRAAGDSVDVVIGALAPVDSIRSGADVQGPVRLNLWMLDRRDMTVMQDSVPSAQNVASGFAHRVASGWYMLRAEASAAGAKRAASTTTHFNAGADLATGFATAGFGMSDILVASRLTLPDTRARGWRDFGAAPLAGAHSRRIPLALVWESYGLVAEQGEARYDLAITFERERGASGRVVAEIIDKLTAPVSTDRADNRVTFHFSRTAPYGSTIVEGLVLGLTDTPRGTYKLTVEVTDKVSGRKTSRTTIVEIGE